MQIVWPSACRALELFRGAKVDPSGDTSDLVPLTNPPPVARHKRSAEQLLDDSFNAHRPTTSNRFEEMHPVRRTNTQQQQQQQSNFSSAIEDFSGDNYLTSSLSASLPSLTGPNMVPSSYGWESGGMNTNSINTHLSTALPQLYSTGIMDENIHASRMHSNFNQHTTNPSSRRYPTYYSYSPFAPLEPVYDDIRAAPIQVSQPQSQQTSQLYLPENYNIYSMLLSGFLFTDP